MPKFCILNHDHPFPHWDFLLEAGESCRTWRLLDEPGSDRTVRAEPIADHRLRYLDYEGPIGGGRGHVTVWDRGQFSWILDGKDRIEVHLSGGRLRGSCCVVHDDGQARVTFDG